MVDSGVGAGGPGQLGDDLAGLLGGLDIVDGQQGQLDHGNHVHSRSLGSLEDPGALEQVLVDRARSSPLASTVVDSLDRLASRWGADKGLRFFSRACPQRFDLGGLAYWRAPREPLGNAFLEGVRRITLSLDTIVTISGVWV